MTCVFYSETFCTGHTTPRYICFLDVSKAYDLANHCMLFIKLVDSDIPLLIVRILEFWYQTQQLCVKNKFSNGVRQGGILLTKLFPLTMNGLTNELYIGYIGCYINDK